MDKRKYTRILIDVMVEIHLADGTHLYGKTANLSLGGAFIKLTSPPTLRQATLCKLELIIKTEEGWVRVEFESSIVHNRDDGIGIRFDAANTAHHESFLKLLIDGTDDIDQLLEELSQHPRQKFRFSDK
jgi:c-di-GMP-binding flagellar brake protein YcgR